MSRHHLRKDQVCQNCGETVEQRFCPKCGQENIETRQSFGHLFRHFVEDLTHYDGAFWLTMKHLLFRPAFLTKEYLSGKRIRFVPPVRLYIFISFVTFFLPYILPDVDYEEQPAERSATRDTIPDSLRKEAMISFSSNDDLIIKIPRMYRTVAHFDSVQAAKPQNVRLGKFDRWLAKKYIHLQKYDEFELGEKFWEGFGHNFPKGIFIYLPLFALILWLFHGKKRWLYFDHAIFTLHYFSFILLVFNALTITEEFFFLGSAIYSVMNIMLLLLVLAIFGYFLMAHKRMYGESLTISFLKSLCIYGINLALFVVILLGLSVISLFSIS